MGTPTCYLFPLALLLPRKYNSVDFVIVHFLEGQLSLFFPSFMCSNKNYPVRFLGTWTMELFHLLPCFLFEVPLCPLFFTSWSFGPTCVINTHFIISPRGLLISSRKDVKAILVLPTTSLEEGGLIGMKKLLEIFSKLFRRPLFWTHGWPALWTMDMRFLWAPEDLANKQQCVEVWGHCLGQKPQEVIGNVETWLP